MLLLLGMILAGCGPTDRERASRAGERVTGSDVTPGLLASSVQLDLELANAATGVASTSHCHGTVLQLFSVFNQPQQTDLWLLIAAHCLGGDIHPPNGSDFIQIVVSHNDVDTIKPSEVKQRVFLHPQAMNNQVGDGSWKDLGFNPDTDCAHDLALVRLSPSVSIGDLSAGRPALVEPARLYHFGCSGYNAGCQDNLADVAGEFPGAAGGLGGAESTGHLHAGDMQLQTAAFCSSSGDPVVGAVADHARADGGDSGGGLFITAPSPSYPIGGNAWCDALPTADHFDTALAGVTSKLAEDNSATFFTPVYLPAFSPHLHKRMCGDHECPANADWIADTMRNSHDKDGICDEIDNCPDTDNVDQANANAVAENEFNGRHIGDKCDGAPTPQVSLSGAPGGIISVQNTRAIADTITVHPVLDDGSSVTSAAHGLFCLCRKADGTPIADKQLCKQGPWFCDLKPWYDDRSDAGFDETATPATLAASLPGGTTTWHFISVLEPGIGCPLGHDCITDHHFPLAYPGSDHTGTWLYQTDNARWNDLGYFDNQPVAPDPSYPAGTDLGGELWMHDPTLAGAEQHWNLPDDGVPCSSKSGFCTWNNVADSYQFGVAPDRRVAGNLQHFDLGMSATDAPLGGMSATETAVFPGETSGEPPPVVTLDGVTGQSLYWLSGGRRFSADAIVSPRLRQEFVDPAIRWVGASEPVTVSQSTSIERAAALSSDGSRFLDAVVRTDSGYAALSETVIGQGGRAPQRAAAPATGVAPAPRAGFGATLSRVTGVLSVIGGHDASGRPTADAWTLRPDGGHDAELFGAPPPVDVEAATYAWKDERAWLVEDVAPRAGHGQSLRVLYRIQPETGWIEGTYPIGALGWADRVWLATAEDGRVLLTAAGQGRWVTALLSFKPCTAADRADPDPHANTCSHGRIAVDGFASGTGVFAAAPRILDRRVSAAFVQDVPGGRVLDLRFIADLRTLRHGQGTLDADLE